MSDFSTKPTAKPIGMQVPLLQLYVYLSEGYNLSCRQCWQAVHASKNGKAPHFLSVDTLQKTIEEALPLGLQAVRLSGAYPLLHPDLAAILNLLEQMELGIIIEASGPGMTSELAHRLARLPQVSVSVGLDGATAATHDSIHGTPGLFDLATQTLQQLSDAGIAPEIVFTIRRRNATQIPALIKLAEQLKAGGIRFNLPQAQPCQPGGAVSDDLKVEELIAIGRRVERELAFTTRLHLIFDQPPAFRGLQPQARIEGQGRCGVMNMLGVLSNGQFALCGLGQSIPELVFGKAGQDSLNEIWKENSSLQSLRDGMPEKLEGICDRCIMKTACLGNCTVENYLRTGSFWTPYWFCEAAERAGLFPAGRLIENMF